LRSEYGPGCVILPGEASAPEGGDGFAGELFNQAIFFSDNAGHSQVNAVDQFGKLDLIRMGFSATAILRVADLHSV
jgi:hypothetical protein